MSISSFASLHLRARQVLPAIAGIYISQTVITALTTQALPSLLRDAGASLQVAGLTALLWIPWGIRFLWAPVVGGMLVRAAPGWKAVLVVRRKGAVLDKASMAGSRGEAREVFGL